MESELENGKPSIVSINSDLLNWDGKGSHPWIMEVEIGYRKMSSNGLPKTETNQLLEELEDAIKEQLGDSEGYLNVGRQTAEGTRIIYFACKEFRVPSKVLNIISKQYAKKLEIQYDIYKDKYWQTFDKFKQTSEVI